MFWRSLLQVSPSRLGPSAQTSPGMEHSPDEPVIRLKLSPSAGEQENSDKCQYLGQRPYVTITVAFARNLRKLVQQSMQNYLS